eukprot:GHVN01082686.1.p1 GENE.GHVN01082686.1~~GHVN01082686.1.p1  ORF type:complete len:1277 (+),score=344.85 GHVN01082686.1:81-3833(+)
MTPRSNPSSVKQVQGVDRGSTAGLVDYLSAPLTHIPVDVLHLSSFCAVMMANGLKGKVSEMKKKLANESVSLSPHRGVVRPSTPTPRQEGEEVTSESIAEGENEVELHWAIAEAHLTRALVLSYRQPPPGPLPTPSQSSQQHSTHSTGRTMCPSTSPSPSRTRSETPATHSHSESPHPTDTQGQQTSGETDDVMSEFTQPADPSAAESHKSDAPHSSQIELRLQLLKAALCERYLAMGRTDYAPFALTTYSELLLSSPQTRLTSSTVSEVSDDKREETKEVSTIMKPSEALSHLTPPEVLNNVAVLEMMFRKRDEAKQHFKEARYAANRAQSELGRMDEELKVKYGCGEPVQVTPVIGSDPVETIIKAKQLLTTALQETYALGVDLVELTRAREEPVKESAKEAKDFAIRSAKKINFIKEQHEVLKSPERVWVRQRRMQLREALATIRFNNALCAESSSDYVFSSTEYRELRETVKRSTHWQIDSWIKLICFAIERKDLSEAQRYAQRGFLHNPHSIEMVITLANVFTKQERTEKAISTLEGYMKCHPVRAKNHTHFLTYLATLRHLHIRHQLTEHARLSALKRQGEVYGHQRTPTYPTLEHINIVKARYEQALNLAHDNFYAAINFASVLGETGQVDDAVSIMTQLLDAADSVKDHPVAVGHGEGSKAPAAGLNDVGMWSAVPDDLLFRLHLNLGLLQSCEQSREDFTPSMGMNRDLEVAVDHLRKAVNIRPLSRKANLCLARVLFDGRLFSECVRVLEECVGKWPNDLSVSYNLALGIDKMILQEISDRKVEDIAKVRRWLRLADVCVARLKVCSAALLALAYEGTDLDPVKINQVRIGYLQVKELGCDPPKIPPIGVDLIPESLAAVEDRIAAMNRLKEGFQQSLPGIIMRNKQEKLKVIAEQEEIRKNNEDFALRQKKKAEERRQQELKQAEEEAGERLRVEQLQRSIASSIPEIALPMPTSQGGKSGKRGKGGEGFIDDGPGGSGSDEGRESNKEGSSGGESGGEGDKRIHKKGKGESKKRAKGSKEKSDKADKTKKRRLKAGDDDERKRSSSQRRSRHSGEEDNGDEEGEARGKSRLRKSKGQDGDDGAVDGDEGSGSDSRHRKKKKKHRSKDEDGLSKRERKEKRRQEKKDKKDKKRKLKGTDQSASSPRDEEGDDDDVLVGPSKRRKTLPEVNPSGDSTPTDVKETHQPHQGTDETDSLFDGLPDSITAASTLSQGLAPTLTEEEEGQRSTPSHSPPSESSK